MKTAVLFLVSGLAVWLLFLFDSSVPQEETDGETKHIATLIKELDSTDFQTRERASNELAQIGEAAIKPLEHAARHGVSLEVRRRAEQAVENIERHLRDLIQGGEVVC